MGHGAAREVQQAYQAICQHLGQPITFDAAQVGARARRLRLCWTNLAAPAAVSAVLGTVKRPAGHYVDHILDPGRVAQLARSKEQPHWYPCNRAGQQLVTVPTLMATAGSYAFRGVGTRPCWDRGSGLRGPAEGHKLGQRCVYDANSGTWQEPNPDERERALGYATGATAVSPVATGVSARQRHAVLGRCMDAQAV